MIWAALALSLAAWGGAPGESEKKDDASLIRQDITIKAKSAGGPPVQVPPPAPDKAVLNEVIRSLDVYARPHKAGPPAVRLEATEERLARPFPEPPFLVFPSRHSDYDQWLFEIFSGDDFIWGMKGEAAEDKPEWDGTGRTGAMAAVAGKSYYFQFTGRKGGQDFTLSSVAILFRSLAFKEALGDVHLEIGNFLLFKPGKSAFTEGADLYLREMGSRMRRVNLRDEPYRLELYQDKPGSKLAKARAAALSRFFSKYLLISAARISVDIRPIGERGDATACVLPMEPGAMIKMD